MALGTGLAKAGLCAGTKREGFVLDWVQKIQAGEVLIIAFKRLSCANLCPSLCMCLQAEYPKYIVCVIKDGYKIF